MLLEEQKGQMFVKFKNYNNVYSYSNWTGKVRVASESSSSFFASFLRNNLSSVAMYSAKSFFILSRVASAEMPDAILLKMSVKKKSFSITKVPQSLIFIKCVKG